MLELQYIERGRNTSQTLHHFYSNSTAKPETEASRETPKPHKSIIIVIIIIVIIIITIMINNNISNNFIQL